MVSKADIREHATALEGCLTLADSAARLGLKRQRLSGLLPTICPDAEKIGGLGGVWSIPAAWVDRWEELLSAQLRMDPVARDCVSLDHLLRYWPWTDDQIGQLLVDVSAGRLMPLGVLAGQSGIGALLLGTNEVRLWFASRHRPQTGEITLPDAAVKLDLKQEVVYALVRSGLLVAVARRTGRRTEWRLPPYALEKFQAHYILCRDVARTAGRSPKAVAAFLARQGVKPVAGPGVDRCRQLVFLRSAIDECLRGGETAS